MYHIVHITSAHRIFSTRIFERECRTLAQAKYRVSLIAPHTRYEIIDNIELIPIPQYRNRFIRMTLGVWKVYVNALHLKADIYHFHDPELLPVVILLKYLKRTRIIYDVHENYTKKILSKHWIPSLFRFFISKLFFFIEKYLANKFDGLVTATENIAHQFYHPKIAVVKNYPYKENTYQDIYKRGDSKDNYKIIYTGGLTMYRGIYQIIKALSYIKNNQVRLIILGKSVSPRFEKKLRKLSGFKKVIYLGMVPLQEVYKNMYSSAIGLVCNQPVFNYDQAQPNKLFEYMSTGLPVIASNFKIWKEIVEVNKCGITVDPTSPEKIAEAIDFLINNYELRCKMGKNARTAILEKYNWENEAEKLLKFYRKVLYLS